MAMAMATMVYSPVLTSCSNLWIRRNLAKAKQLNNLEQLSGAALFVYKFVYKEVLLMIKDDEIILKPNIEHKKINDLFANFEGEYTPAEFEWGEPVGHEYKVKKSPFCFRQCGDFY